MSFYRTMLAAIAAIAIASPVLAAEETTTSTTTVESATPTEQSVDQTTTTTTTSMTETKVNINTASAKELMKVKGINAAKAKAIVAYRKKHGDFKSMEELANVRGFKKMPADMMKSIQDQLTIE